MTIRIFTVQDLAAVGALWDACRKNDGALYRPFDEGYFKEKFLDGAVYEPALLLVSCEDGKVTGFIAGCRKHAFLPGETEQNTPGYLTTLMVSPAYRKRGTACALLDALEERFRLLGKTKADVSSLNPIDLHWLIPGTPAHEHNNMPGADEENAATGFLLSHGYKPTVHEVAMYLNLSDYKKADFVEQKRSELLRQGIVAGRYDPKENCEWDGMCDRVGSEYWRKVLRDELAKPSPRPLFCARTEGHIVGFTGPADVEESGRGWFTGICTDPLYEQKGIATVLFNDLMNCFISIGAKYSSLFTGTENHAQRLYLKTGFRPARRFAMLRKEL